VPQGPLFEGRFGRMFRRLPVFEVEKDDLRDLADSMTQTGFVPTRPRPRCTTGVPMLLRGRTLGVASRLIERERPQEQKLA
jgi:hypothetical protein